MTDPPDRPREADPPAAAARARLARLADALDAAADPAADRVRAVRDLLADAEPRPGGRAGAADAAPDPARLAAAWFRHGLALRAWDELAAGFGVGPAPAAARPPAAAHGPLARRCRALADRIAVRTGQNSGAARFLSLIASRDDHTLLIEAGRALAACHDALAGPAAGDGEPAPPREDVRPLAKAVTDTLARLRDDAPARVAARLLARWRAAAPDAAAGADRLWDAAEVDKWAARSELGRALAGEEFAWVLLARGLAAVADRLAAAAPAHADAIYAPLRDAVAAPAAGPRVAVKLLREPPPDRVEPLEATYQVEESPTATAARVVQSGLWVDARPAAPGAKPLTGCFPRPKLVVPAARSKPVAALDGLVAALVAAGRPDHGVLAAARALLEAWEVPGEGRASFSLIRWWAAAPAEDRARLWWLAQRLTLLARLDPASEPAVAGVVQALAAEKFHLVPTPAGAADAATPWFLEPAGPGEPPADAPPARGAALHTPAGVFGATFFLRLRTDAAGANPVAAALRDVEPFLAVVRFADPRWEEWPAVNAAQAEALGPPAAAKAGLELLTLFHRRQAAAPPEAAVAYRKVVRRLFAALTGELGVRVVPELDAEGRPARLPPTAAGVEWVADDAPAGTVLGVDRFGTAADPPAVRASIGPRVPPEVARWLDLPGPVEQVAGCPPLADWRAAVRAVLWEPADRQPAAYREAAAQAGRQLADWLGGADGRDWFDLLARAATSDPAARAWLARLVAEGWCGCFPAVDPGTGEPGWPAGGSVNQPNVRVRFVPDQGPAVRVGEVEWFAPTAAAARCEVLVREPGSDTPAAAARAVAAAAGSWEAAAAVVRAETDALVRGEGPSAERTTALLPDLLAAVAACEDTETAARVLAAARDWAGRSGVEVLPRGWAPGTPLRAADLGPDEPATAVRFAPADAGLVAAVNRFGWVGPAGGQAPEVVVSAGPRPAGYDALKAALGPSKAARPLAERVKQFPVAGKDGRLQEAFVDLFKAFWAAEPAFRRDDPAAAAATAAALEAALGQNFGLATFEPRPGDLQDNRRAEVVEGEVRTGRIVAVRRPGLETRDGWPVVSAQVVAE